MQLVVLCGPPGVGKLSIARELAGRSGYRLFHNHLTVDLLESLFEFGSEPFVELRERYWLELLGRAADEGVGGVIFTLAFDRTISTGFIARLYELCRGRRIELSLVELSCAPDELERRILAPERARHGKLNSLERYRELAQSGAFVRPLLPDQVALVDTTGLSVAESAGRVYRQVVANDGALRVAAPVDGTPPNHRIITVANAIRSGRYSDADAVFAAGSIVRGEGTASSDLDLVVVYTKLPRAYRESFRFDGYPVEAFVHDQETLEYFFDDVDRPSGVPALAQMIYEGVEIPSPNDTSRELKRLAASVIAAGPPPLDHETEQRMRYSVSDLIDDLRTPRSRGELIGAGSRLYEQLADYHLRLQGHWSAKGKAITRVLRQVDPDLCGTYVESFNTLFARGDATEVVRLAEELLKPAGGPLFEGYRSDAPASWRKGRSE